MERIGISELGRSAAKNLALVKGGHTVEIVEDGELVALLVPPSQSQTARDRLIARGRLIPATNPTGRARFGRPIAPEPGQPSSQEILDEMRADRL